MYRYLGDKLTDPALKGALCEAVRRGDGRCIRGTNGNMLVRFGDRMVVVVGRHLRKQVSELEDEIERLRRELSREHAENARLTSE
jgi:hypothetical protein